VCLPVDERLRRDLTLVVVVSFCAVVSEKVMSQEKYGISNPKSTIFFFK